VQRHKSFPEMKARPFLLLRLSSALIDLSVIYSLAVLFQMLIGNFTFISFGDIFIWSFLVYFFISYWFLKGQTIAKLLTGIRVVKKNDEALSIKNIIVRELLEKGIIGLLIPVYLFESVFQIWSPMLTVAVVSIVLLFSFIFLIIFKKTWWEMFSFTISKKEPVFQKSGLTISFISISILIVATLYQFLSPFYKNMQQAKFFSSKYPITAEVNRYANFVKHNSKDPVDYVFDLFNKYDFVVLTERIHSEYTQYELISRIIEDPRFEKQVGNIFTEQGSVSFQDTLQTYLHTSFANEDDLNKSTANLQRNSNGVYELWDYTNLFDFLKTVNRLNNSKADSNKINWYFTDLPVNWETMTADNYLKGYTPQVRDSLMADHVIEKYNSVIEKQKRKKALLIMNSIHGFGYINLNSGLSCNWMNNVIPGYSYINNKGTTTYLMNSFPGKVANILINTVSQKYGPVFLPVQNGKWEAAFSLLENPEVGFNFSGSPFGDDAFDLFFYNPKSIAYKDVFTGFIFFKPLESHIKKSGFPHEFDQFEDTLLRRASCVGPSSVELAKRKIYMHKSNPQNSVDSEILPYGLFYNLVNVVLISVILIFVELMCCVFFYRNFKQK
jgi:uncharacterized RDD family membrane protein YckC